MKRFLLLTANILIIACGTVVGNGDQEDKPQKDEAVDASASQGSVISEDVLDPLGFALRLALNECASPFAAVSGTSLTFNGQELHNSTQSSELKFIKRNDLYDIQIDSVNYGSISNLDKDTWSLSYSLAEQYNDEFSCETIVLSEDAVEIDGASYQEFYVNFIKNSSSTEWQTIWYLDDEGRLFKVVVNRVLDNVASKFYEFTRAD